ncbi:hypothetical protein EYC80_007160 [Monilinia laxa]|uniref:Uncharacterized protein n=1 Tax=Monilinia laxa TaxID=61186 RepID=A0A5N6K0C9_MONLA|nr:hypothetical protein EYC80_007160 [Monilinia laxa]
METWSTRARQRASKKLDSPGDPFGNNYIAAKGVEFEDSIIDRSGGEYGKDGKEEKLKEKGEEEGVGVSKRSVTKKRKFTSGKKAEVPRKRMLREKGA